MIVELESLYTAVQVRVGDKYVLIALQGTVEWIDSGGKPNIGETKHFVL